MREVVIGTAGHIDHGKSALVQALTGTNPDRLAEEQRRGITIEPGYAYAALGDDWHAGFVDLPGHEKLVKNLLIGAGGISLVLMAVAADEGVMPQTIEHLQILQLLGLRHGVIALTRCDLADAQTRAFAREELAEAFAGSFLERAQVVETCAVTGMGIDALRRALAGAAEALPILRADRPLFFPIDRVFSKAGFGVIATGMLRDGTIRIGDRYRICPGGGEVRVRGLERGGQAAEMVCAGQRAAANLGGVKVEQLARGSLLLERDFSTSQLDVRVEALASSAHPIRHNTRLHLAIGTAYLRCRLLLLEGETIPPGGFAYARLRLETPVATRPGERFVLRFFSPVETVAGGVVLDADPPMQPRAMRLDHLRALDGTDTAAQFAHTLDHACLWAQELRERYWYLSQAECDEALEQLKQAGQLRDLGGLLCTSVCYEREWAALTAAILAHTDAHPLDFGPPRTVLQKRWPDALLQAFCADGRLELLDGALGLAGTHPLGREPGQSYAQKMTAALTDAGFACRTAAELAESIGCSERDCARVLGWLCRCGTVTELSAQDYLMQERLMQAMAVAKPLLANASGMTLAEFRDALGLSRRYTQILLEYFDGICYTRRDGDRRFPVGSP